MAKPTFDMDAAVKALREGKDLRGKDGILTPLIKQLSEAAMKAQLEEHLASEDKPNRKNDTTFKAVKSPAGSSELQAPRDPAGTFEPQIVKKHLTQLIDEMESKVITLFALDNNYQDIRTHIADINGMELSNGVINTVTESCRRSYKFGASAI